MHIADDPTGDAAFLISEMWLNGFHDTSAGNMELTDGHWIYHEIAGVHYGLNTHSTGATELYEFEGHQEAEQHQAEVESNPADDEDGNEDALDWAEENLT